MSRDDKVSTDASDFIPHTTQQIDSIEALPQDFDFLQTIQYSKIVSKGFFVSKNKSKGAESSESNLLTSLLGNAVQQGSFYFVGVTAASVVSVIALPIYARIFTPAEYGLLSLVLLVVSIGNIVIGNWLTTCTTRFLPYYQRIQESNIFYSTVLLSMIFALAALILLGVPAYFLLRGFFDTALQPLIPLIAALIALSVVFQISLNILRVKQEARRYVVFYISSICLALMIGIPMAIFLGLGISGILWGQAITLLILGTIMFRRLFLAGSGARLRANSLPVVKEFALYGFPAAASSIGTWLLSGADRYVIEYSRGATEVGLYSMGYGIGDVIMMLVSAFILTATPTLMITYESDNREITSQLLSQLTRIFLLIGLPATVGISALAAPVIRLLTTESYYPASVVIPFVAFGDLTYGLCLLSYTGLQTAKKSPVMARNWVAAGALNILLNIIFVPRFGFVAAAVNTLVSYMALLLLNIKSANKYLRWAPIPRSAINTAVASVVMGGVVFLVTHFSASAVVACISGIIVGIVVYLVMLFLLKEFSQGEILQIKRFFKDKLTRAKHP